MVSTTDGLVVGMPNLSYTVEYKITEPYLYVYKHVYI